MLYFLETEYDNQNFEVKLTFKVNALKRCDYDVIVNQLCIVSYSLQFNRTSKLTVSKKF